jgi:thiamine-phosphate pyrophosphorylase
MLVVISSPTAVANEAAIINGLFDEGLEILHLRRPDITIEEMRSLLQKIKPQYYHQVSLHQHHEAADDFGITRLHYTEVYRGITNDKALLRLKEKSYVLSTSIHRLDEYIALSASYEYTFFGPVFDSISKAGYVSQLSDDFVFPVAPGRPKVIAIGGIDASNIGKAMDMNFSGVAALGSIWSKPDEGIMQFKKIREAWTEAGR